VADLIPFPRRDRPEATPPAEQPAAQRPSREELRSADRRRMLENLAALVFIVCFMALAFWVMDRVTAYSHNVTCLSARLKECR
jgi:ferric-dicitrate binding protein FerR (iron transport regulator)